MTLKELNRFRSMIEKKNKSREALMALRNAASPKASLLTGMPISTGARDRVGDLASEIADLDNEIIELGKRIDEQRPEVQAFIFSISDGYIRTAFSLRFLRGMLWEDVADSLGATEDGVKKMCYRYMRKMSRHVLDCPDVL